MSEQPMTEVNANPGVPGSPASPDSDLRVEQFRSEMEDLKLKGSSGDAERWMLIAGIILAVVGLALAIMGAIQVVNAGDDPATQRAGMASGSLLGLVLLIAGCALFIRFSLGRYLRFWLVRLVYEGRADTDRIVDAIDRAAGPAPQQESAAGFASSKPES